MQLHMTIYVTFKESRKYFFRAVYLFEQIRVRCIPICSNQINCRAIFQERPYITWTKSFAILLYVHSSGYASCNFTRATLGSLGNQCSTSSLSAAVDWEELLLPILRFFVPHIGLCRMTKITGVGVKDTHRWCRSCVGWATKPRNIGLVLLKWSVLIHTANFGWGDWRSVDWRLSS